MYGVISYAKIQCLFPIIAREINLLKYVEKRTINYFPKFFVTVFANVRFVDYSPFRWVDYGILDSILGFTETESFLYFYEKSPKMWVLENNLVFFSNCFESSCGIGVYIRDFGCISGSCTFRGIQKRFLSFVYL